MNQQLLSQNESYRNNPKLKSQGVSVTFTQDQLAEYIKCKNDPIYFIINYVKIVTLDGGVVPFKLWPFQKRLIKTLHNNRFVIAKILRQVGKTTTVLSYLLWIALFTEQQNILIAANKRLTAEQILEKLKLSYENIPIWMQQGIVEWNKGNIALENGSKVRASSTTSGAARSGSYNIVLLDEFAHVESRIAEDFYTSVYPVITSGKTTKIFMISTPKGMNLFYKFWKGAEKKTNGYVPFEVHWSDVPGRDQKWYEETLANIGEKNFEQEFLCSFLGSTSTLVSGAALNKLEGMWKEPVGKYNDLSVYEHPIKENWDEDEGKLISIDHTYVISVDTSEGKGLDYHALNVIDVTTLPYKVVATYRNNELSHMLLPSVISSAGRYYNNAYVLIEIASTGLQIAQSLVQDLEYENILWVSSGNKKSQQISAGHTKGSAYGVKMTKPVRDIGCSNLKTLIETDQLICEDFATYSEFTTFALNNSGKYEADGEDAHDDSVMSLVLFGWLTSQKYFKDLTSNVLRKALKQQFIEYNDEEMLPAPMIDDGIPQEIVKIGDELWVEFRAGDNQFADPYGRYLENFRNMF